MLDYKTFKKGYLTEWVDRSQAARKAAEELAKKEVKPSLRDKYAYVFDLDGHKVEFKPENEINSKEGTAGLFTQDEALSLFGEPDKDGWRLPTLTELRRLLNYYYDFDKKARVGIIGNIMVLPQDGVVWSRMKIVTDKRHRGYYWTTDRRDDRAWCMEVAELGLLYNLADKNDRMSVRLIRDVK